MEFDTEFKVDWPIRQGDLIGFWDWRGRPPLDRFGMIITADCDIENGRPDQNLVYLRIIAQADYVDLFWSRSKLLNARLQALRDLSPQVNRLRRNKDPAAVDLAIGEVELWLSSADSNEIADSIAVPDENERIRLIKNLDRTKLITELASASFGTSCFDNLIRVRNQTKQDLLKQATNDLRSNRDELFFVTSVTDRDDQSGYYILLDQIGAARRDQITDSMDALKSGVRSAYRFGTLAKTYKYSVAQRFAYLFQKIGLPNDYHERHLSALSSISAESIRGV